MQYQIRAKKYLGTWIVFPEIYDDLDSVLKEMNNLPLEWIVVTYDIL